MSRLRLMRCLKVKVNSNSDLYDESDRITVSQLKELIYCVDSLIGDSEDICGCFNAYNVLIFLCRFVGNKELADYYGLCSDYTLLG